MLALQYSNPANFLRIGNGSLQCQVIHTFVKEVILWDDHVVIFLTLNNTQETVTFEEIRKFKKLSNETQEPLPDESESGSCSIEFAYGI